MHYVIKLVHIKYHSNLPITGGGRLASLSKSNSASPRGERGGRGGGSIIDRGGNDSAKLFGTVFSDVEDTVAPSPGSRV